MDDTFIATAAYATLGHTPPGTEVSYNSVRVNFKKLGAAEYARAVRTVAHELGESEDSIAQG